MTWQVTDYLRYVVQARDLDENSPRFWETIAGFNIEFAAAAYAKECREANSTFLEYRCVYVKGNGTLEPIDLKD